MEVEMLPDIKNRGAFFLDFLINSGKIGTEMNERNIAFANDNRILEMATYWESKGNMVSLQSMEAVFSRFAEFKGLVKRGSFTMEQLEKHVFEKFGLIDKKSIGKQNDEDYLLKLISKELKQSPHEKK